MSDGAGSPPAADGQYTAAIDTCRATLKWVLTSFAGIAAALIAGVQLTSIGKLQGWRLESSLVCAGVGFAGVFVIIVSAVRVLLPVVGTYTQFADAGEFTRLRDFLENDPSPLRGKATNAADLASKYDAALAGEIEAYENYNADRSDLALKAAYKGATAERAALYPTLQAVTALGVYLRVRHLCDQTMCAIRFLVPIIAASAITFAYLANPPGT